MQFLLEPGIVFLNHGSFGACPREVFEAYQHFQRRLESQPVRFMQRELPGLLAEARAVLARLLGADAGEVVFVRNATYAVNEVARSMRLEPTDEVLLSDQEYGACHNVWRFMSQQRGFSIVQRPIRLPVASEKEIVEQFWGGVTDNTKAIFLSHITSPTALTMPVAEICRRARQQGILTVIDGAHAPGQMDVDLKSIGADFYAGTCHKWLCAPKGAAFLYARREVQHLIEPLVVGWGWGTEQRTFDSGSDFLDFHEWLGTDDPSAFLSVPKAIEFQERHDWVAVRQRCHKLAVRVIEEATRIDGVARVHPNDLFYQMALLEITRGGNAEPLKSELYKRGIEVPLISWNGRLFVRVSLQAYNTVQDVEQFVTALREVVEQAHDVNQPRRQI
jgi:isopenicillin-N epimerase